MEETFLRHPFRRRAALTRFAPAFLLLWLAAGSLAAAEKPAAAVRREPFPNPALLRQRWHVIGTRPLAMYYYTPGLGLDSLQQHAAEMTLLAPQCFVVSAKGFVFGEVPPQVLEITRAAKLPVMPLVVNRGFDRSTVRLLLRDPRAQERAALYMAYLAKRGNFLGWQLDLENLDPADKLLYTRFVERVAARLHRDGRLLSVAVVPRFSDAYPARVQEPFPTGEWGAPYDFRALGRVADFLTLMTYNHHTTLHLPVQWPVMPGSRRRSITPCGAYPRQSFSSASLFTAGNG